MGLSKQKSISRWIESCKIPVVKFGERTYRISARAVIAQLKESGYEHLVNDPYEDQFRNEFQSHIPATLNNAHSL